MKRIKRFLIVLISLLLIVSIAFGCYVENYYEMDEQAAEICAEANEEFPSEKVKDRYMVFRAEGTAAGFIFYPGGKVDAGAYAPLLQKLQQKGITCILCKMPFRLAVFGLEAADGIQNVFPEIKHWYIGGHSLGGVMAAEYAAKNTAELDGLVLLAAYSIKDLSGSGLKVLSVYGSEDGVLDLESYENKRVLLPSDTRELVIKGGCHAFFGNYGAQKGDGIPAISRDMQLSLTANAIAEMMG